MNIRPRKASNRELTQKQRAQLRASLKADDADRKITGLWRPRTRIVPLYRSKATGNKGKGLEAVYRHLRAVGLIGEDDYEWESVMLGFDKEEA